MAWHEVRHILPGTIECCGKHLGLFVRGRSAGAARIGREIGPEHPILFGIDGALVADKTPPR